MLADSSPSCAGRRTLIVGSGCRAPAVVHVKKGQWCDASVDGRGRREGARRWQRPRSSLCEQWHAVRLRRPRRRPGQSCSGWRGAGRTGERRRDALAAAAGRHASVAGGEQLGAAACASSSPTVARAACAAGVDGLFMEVHDDSDRLRSATRRRSGLCGTCASY